MEPHGKKMRSVGHGRKNIKGIVAWQHFSTLGPQVGMAPAGYGYHPVPLPVCPELAHHPYPYPSAGIIFTHTLHPTG